MATREGSESVRPGSAKQGTKRTQKEHHIPIQEGLGMKREKAGAQLGGGVKRRSVLGAAAGASLLAAPWVRRAAAAEPIRLGVLVDMSSWGRDTGGPGSVVAAQMAAEEMGGQIAGRPIEILSGDHQMKTDVGLEIARNWIDTKNALAIVDVPNSAIGIAISGLAKQKNRLALLSGAGSSAITDKLCNANTVQFTYDTYALAKVTTQALSALGAKTWYFITADYSFGHQLQADATRFIQEAGGRVLGAALHPTGTSDFSSQLLAAQASKADAIALANAASDTVNTIKQAAEFGIGESRNGQRVAALLMFLSDVHGLGLEAAQGTLMTTACYWNMNAQTRAWSERFFARAKVMPNMEQAGTYGVVLHYLKAVAKVGTDPQAAMRQMQAMPINDVFFKGTVRADGRALHDMYLAQVKRPSESKEAWDYLKILKTVGGDQAFRPVSESSCPLLHKA
jgi:branched-chain amino acid transport system substrate-binding protein